MTPTVTVDQNEINKLLKKFGRLRDELDARKELRKSFLKAAKPVVESIKAATPVKTGKLKQSIGVIPYLGSTNGRVYVGVKKEKVEKKKTYTTFYGAFLEFGTKYIKKAKHAFFFKAGESAIPASLRILQKSLEQRINRLGI